MIFYIQPLQFCCNFFYELYEVTKDLFKKIITFFFRLRRHSKYSYLFNNPLRHYGCWTLYHYKLWLWNAPRGFSTRRRLFEKSPHSPPPPWSRIYPQGSPYADADADVATHLHVVTRLMNAWNQPGSPWHAFPSYMPFS